MTSNNPNRLRALPWIALALSLVVVALLGFQLGTAHRLLDAQRQWQVGIVTQIGAAVSRDGVRGAALTPDESGEALARIIAARDGATAMIADLSATRGRSAAAIATAAPPAAMPGDGTDISRLNRTQSTGSAAGDARIIERDSRAAWTGWK